MGDESLGFCEGNEWEAVLMWEMKDWDAVIGMLR